MKHIAISIIIIIGLFYSCDDYVETGIEGRWQLTKIQQSNGDEIKVDTIFYSFKKDVFQYLKLKTDITWGYCFGVFSERNDSLIIDVREYSEFIKDHWDGETYRGFKVLKKSSSKMELDYMNNVYYLRKY